ncbi:beta-1,4-mannosyl-glycoprotein 4-beta-N-acetylglucosaminyltransferase a [Osmerus eperlanus]|uniref:beta-1,4-mannosyl-glycoprotein 4-beta-N-acetylglucosaminyltransferase a n=1 Tax=Osmerus eperlanus TaxID=29151 RepID=UPI002E15C3BF
MVGNYLPARWRLGRRTVLLFCSLGVCVFSLVCCYQALWLSPRLQTQAPLAPAPVGQLWVEPDRVTLPDPTGPMGEIHQRHFLLQEDSTPYFVRTQSGALCFRDGMEEPAPHRPPPRSAPPPEAGDPPRKGVRPRCVCRPGWHGPHCGVPTLVQHSNLATRGRLLPREVPRRVINAVNINHEFDLLHARFHELVSAVDLFLVCESNFTAYGEPKETPFLRMLLNGTFNYVRRKILYVFLDHFPPGGRRDGWIADDYLRTFLTRSGLSRLRGQRPDDVLILDDADEIPAAAGVLFLKLHDGWTEPFGFHLRKSLYGFFWRQPGTLDIVSGCTLAMLDAVYAGDGILLRRRNYYTLPGFREYEQSAGRRLAPWSLGSTVHYAGWHCSWCFRPEGIYRKLVSAQNGDFPRWGDFEEKRNLSYIRELVRTGGWFDGSVEGYPLTRLGDHMYAPEYVLQNFQQYHYLLKNPYAAPERENI